MSKSPIEDISPAALPFTTRIRELRDGAKDGVLAYTANAGCVALSVDLAKRMLLEMRVRDFTAADVVALAALIEARDLSA